MAIETIEDSGNVLLALINDTLDLSRIKIGQMQREENSFDLASFVENIAVMFQFRCQEKGIGWQME